MKIVSAEIKPAMEHTTVEQTLFRKSLRSAKEGFKISRRYAAPSDFFASSFMTHQALRCIGTPCQLLISNAIDYRVIGGQLQ